MSRAAAPAASARRRVRARVAGTVQGVGFRPHVYRLAAAEGCAGHVFNDARGVELEVEADAAAVARFLRRLAAEAPPLARVERVDARELPPRGGRGFAILASPQDGAPDALVAPDSAACDACLAELADPADRRYRYPFVTCTDCGPRFTIVRGVPYDRPLTTMAGFAMCPACRAEYEDPADRRFHAQPNACPACGPRARLLDAAGAPVGGEPADAVAAAARALAAGMVVAVKGLGGYHLACRAADEDAVAALRARKRREDKPFALMAASVAAARELAALGPQEAALLAGPERPIVLARRRRGARVARAVAPGIPELGVMLPYTPLHHLLLADLGEPIVLTSGNASDEPIAYRDDDALERLAAIADRFLVHDRPIATRVEDSVVRAVDVGGERRALPLRRSRGYVPASVPLPLPAPCSLLACGAELKHTFCVARGARAWVSYHVGDLRDYETLRSFAEGAARFERLFDVRPEAVAHDLHPEYLSTKHAQALDGVRLIGVQHHHAHLAACLAEHGETGRAVGALYDGTGDGGDGTVWGGELLAGGLAGSERVGALWPARLPGGEAAVRQPWRMACAWLVAAGEPRPAVPPALAGRVAPEQWERVAALARSGLASPQTTSAGRLFDAVAALCGVRAETAYEGQAAIELAAACDPRERGAYPLPLVDDGEGGLLRLDARAAVRAAVADLARGTPVPAVAARFHNGLADATARAVAAAAERAGAGVAALSGGVFQNRLLLERTAARLAAARLRVLVPRLLPPGDGGISYGQAAAAAARLAEEG